MAALDVGNFDISQVIVVSFPIYIYIYNISTFDYELFFS